MATRRSGSITPRGENKWMVRVYLGPDAGGKRRYHNHMVHGTKKDAQHYLNVVLSQRDAHSWVEPKKVTLNEHLDTWLDTVVRHRVRPRTLGSYQHLLDGYVRPTLGSRYLAQVTAVEVQRLYSALLTRGLSPRTVRYTHAVLRNALKQAVTWRLVAQNPCDAVELPRQVRSEMQALSAEQARGFLEAAASTPWRALFEVLVVTGMRPGEALGLQWRDIDWDAGRLSVRRALVKQGKEWRLEEPKTQSSRRAIPLPPATMRTLAAHRKQQAVDRLATGPAYLHHDLVFAGQNGQPLDEHNVVHRAFKPLLRQAGLPDSVRLYDLRHTCATLLLAQGVHPKVVSERLGHASVTLTLDTYSHTLPTMQEEATAHLGDMLFRAPTR